MVSKTLEQLCQFMFEAGRDYEHALHDDRHPTSQSADEWFRDTVTEWHTFGGDSRDPR